MDWLALSKASNSACSCAGSGGGPGLEKDDRGGSDRATDVVRARRGKVVFEDEAIRRRLPIMTLIAN